MPSVAIVLRLYEHRFLARTANMCPQRGASRASTCSRGEKQTANPMANGAQSCRLPRPKGGKYQIPCHCSIFNQGDNRFANRFGVNQSSTNCPAAVTGFRVTFSASQRANPHQDHQLGVVMMHTPWREHSNHLSKGGFWLPKVF